MKLTGISSKERVDSQYFSCRAKLECGHVRVFSEWFPDWKIDCYQCSDPSAREEVVATFSAFRVAVGRWIAEEIVESVARFLYRPSLRSDWVGLAPHRRDKIVAQIRSALSERR